MSDKPGKGKQGSDGVRRNAKGGVYVNPAELKQAFEFFDVEGKGYLTMTDLKKRLGVFYQNLTLREYKFLMNNKVGQCAWRRRSAWSRGRGRGVLGKGG